MLVSQHTEIDQHDSEMGDGTDSWTQATKSALIFMCSLAIKLKHYILL